MSRRKIDRFKTSERGLRINLLRQKLIGLVDCIIYSVHSWLTVAGGPCRGTFVYMLWTKLGVSYITITSLVVGKRV